MFGMLRFQKALAGVALTSALLLSGASAQELLNFGAGGLPACAQTCQFLSQAQAGCVPPAAPVTTQDIYLSCFCQSGFLTTLRADATSVCGNVCFGADLPLISQWYTNLCAAGAAPNPAPAADPTATQTTDTPPTTASTTSTGTATSSRQSGTASSNAQGQSWWAGHWQWILMLILIAALLGGLTFAGLWWRKRHHRKRDRMDGRFNDGITSRAMAET